MRYSTASGRRRVRHHRNAGALEQIWKLALRDVTTKLDPWIALALPLHRFHVAGGIRMVSSTHDQLRLRQFCRDQTESLNHQV